MEALCQASLSSATKLVRGRLPRRRQQVIQRPAQQTQILNFGISYAAGVSGSRTCRAGRYALAVSQRCRAELASFSLVT